MKSRLWTLNQTIAGFFPPADTNAPTSWSLDQLELSEQLLKLICFPLFLFRFPACLDTISPEFGMAKKTTVPSNTAEEAEAMSQVNVIIGLAAYTYHRDMDLFSHWQSEADPHQPKQIYCSFS